MTENPQAQVQPLEALPFISVIVPVRNEGPFIGRTLEQLLVQEYDADRFEVLVADGQSSDNTVDVVRSLQTAHANLHLLDNPKRWSSAGRNLAIQAARGELLVVVDGHCELDDTLYLRKLASAFTRSGADCVGRPQPLDASPASPLQRAIAAARSCFLGHHHESFVYSSEERFVCAQSVAVAYRREVFDRVGLFDQSFDACEDVELNHRIDGAGLRCYFTPSARVHYHARPTLWGLFRQMQRYGRGRMRLLRKNPETFTIAGFLPAVFMLWLVIGAAATVLLPALLPLYAGTVAVYALTLGATSIFLCLQTRAFSLLPRLPLVFAAIHLGAGAGILLEMAAPVGSGRARTRALATRPAGVLSNHLRLNGIKHATMTISLMKHQMPSSQFGIEGVLNALTVDVEDYFQVSAFDGQISRKQWRDFPLRVHLGLSKILSVLDAAAVRGTFFFLGWIAEQQPELVREVHAAGHEIACHGHWHRLVYEQTPEEFRADICRARNVLECITGSPVRAYRAPSFSITRRSLWALDVLVEEGFSFDSSIYPIVHDRYGIPGATVEPHRLERPAGEIVEFPAPTCRLLGKTLPVGGGGYFRLYPYCLTRLGLRSINASGRPVAVYLHPWELDPDQPRLRPGLMKAMRHYVNLHRTERRLRQLVADFRFGTLSEAWEQWSGTLSGSLPPCGGGLGWGVEARQD